MVQPTVPASGCGLLSVIDEYTRECLAIDAERELNSKSVLERFGRLFVHGGIAASIRSDNGAEFTWVHPARSSGSL